MTHIHISDIFIIGSDNGLSLGRCQTLIGTNAGLLLIGSLEINISEILITSNTFSFKKMHLKLPFAKCCLSRLSPNESIYPTCDILRRWPISSMCAGNHLYVIQGNSTFKGVSHSKSKYDAVHPYWNTNHMSSPLGCSTDFWNNHMQLQRPGIEVRGILQQNSVKGIMIFHVPAFHISFPIFKFHWQFKVSYVCNRIRVVVYLMYVCAKIIKQ